MNFPKDSSDPTAVIEWAAETLELGEVSSHFARTAFYERLDRTEFCPPDLWFQAMGVLHTGVTLPDKMQLTIPAEMKQHRTETLGGFVDGFCQRFWKLEPGERTTQWQTLWKNCLDVAQLQARLALLKPGVGLEISPEVYRDLPHHDGKTIALLENIIDWFPLAMPERTSLWREWLVRRTDRSEWQYAAQAVLEHRPAIAALEIEMVRLVAGLKNWLAIPKTAGETKKRHSTLYTEGSESEFLPDREPRGPNRRRQNMREVVVEKSKLQLFFEWVKTYFWVVVLIAIFANFMSRKRSFESNSPKHSPKRTDIFNSSEELIKRSENLPEFFTPDGKPRVLQRPAKGEPERSGQATWRLLGGKYTDELLAPPPRKNQ